MCAVGGQAQDTSAKGKKKRRRSQAAGVDAADKWAFLTELDAADQSWLHFALYSAYQSQR